MTTIYCVRHGQSASNAGGLTMEHAANPLSPLGLIQAAALPEIFASVLGVQPKRLLTSSYVLPTFSTEAATGRGSSDCHLAQR